MGVDDRGVTDRTIQDMRTVDDIYFLDVILNCLGYLLRIIPVGSSKVETFGFSGIFLCVINGVANKFNKCGGEVAPFLVG